MMQLAIMIRGDVDRMTPKNLDELVEDLKTVPGALAAETRERLLRLAEAARRRG